MFGRKGLFGNKAPETPVQGQAGGSPGNATPSGEIPARSVEDSLAQQEERRRLIEADLLQKHGTNAIRPFFVLSEPVYNSQLGVWLMRQMDLLPYDEWNLVYLPTDTPTAAAMQLPLHPGCSIKPIDDLMVERLGEIRGNFEEGISKTNALIERGDADQAMARFSAFREHMRQTIIQYVESLKPKIVELIADVQSKAQPSP